MLFSNLPEYIVRFEVIVNQAFAMNEIKAVRNMSSNVFYFLDWDFPVWLHILFNQLGQITLITVLHLNVHAFILLNGLSWKKV